MSKIKLFFFFLLSTLVAYGASLRYGFSQDDFYFLSISKATSLSGVVSFFAPWMQAGFAFYRPLGTQLYYFIFTTIFSYARAPLFMHLFMLIIQGVNAYLVSRLVLELTRDKKLSPLIGILYAVSSVHFLSLFYIAATQQLLAATFSLLSLNVFLIKKYKLAAVYFGLGLLCKETAVITPVLAFLLLQLESPWRFKWIYFKNLITPFIPYLLCGILYTVLRLSSGLTLQSEYHFVLSPSVFTTIRWYWLFGYGAPELLLLYGLPRFGINFAQYIADFGIPAIVTTLGSLSLGLLAFISMLKKRYFIYLFWFIASIFLVMWFPDHRYPHYLDLGLIPLLLILFSPLSSRLRYLLAIVLTVISLSSIYVSILTHWTVKRANLAASEEQTILKSGECQSPTGVTITGSALEVRELSYALSLENGPRVICQNPVLPVYYPGISP